VIALETSEEKNKTSEKRGGAKVPRGTQLSWGEEQRGGKYVQNGGERKRNTFDTVIA